MKGIVIFSKRESEKKWWKKVGDKENYLKKNQCSDNLQGHFSKDAICYKYQILNNNSFLILIDYNNIQWPNPIERESKKEYNNLLIGISECVLKQVLPNKSIEEILILVHDVSFEPTIINNKYYLTNYYT